MGPKPDSIIPHYSVNEPDPIIALLYAFTYHEPRTKDLSGPLPEIARQLQQIEALPKAKQCAITQVLDSVLAAHQ